MGATRDRRAVCLSTVLVLVCAGCVSAPVLDIALRVAIPDPTIRFGVDTFAFANENRFKYRGKPDLYANWCFVMARAVTQFHLFARFDPAAAPLTADGYTERVSQVTARFPWHSALPLDERIVIPGYGSLYEFSRAHERAVKARATLLGDAPLRRSGRSNPSLPDVLLAALVNGPS